jgi:chromosome segregation ATPase
MKEHLNQMHSEHAEWQSKIQELKAQLKKCNDQLAEMVMAKPDAELLAQIEHFQNQFTIQREVLDIMRHDFKQHENAIEAHQRGELNMVEKLNELHIKSKDRLKEYNRIFSELKDEFSSFLQKNFASQD